MQGLQNDSILVKLLTWNIQAGIGTGQYRDYLLRAHRQVVHTQAKTANLHAIADVMSDYDVVCLQEVDLGGRRAGYQCQATDLAGLSGLDHFAVQENRTIRGLSRHGNAIFSRWPLRNEHDIKLPGRLRGRGCLIATLDRDDAITVACLHLSLGLADQSRQLDCVASHLKPARRWVAMGDFNCRAHSAPMAAFCETSGGHVTHPTTATYPSWKPSRDYDHIVAGQRVALSHYTARPVVRSDHLPVEATLDQAH